MSMWNELVVDNPMLIEAKRFVRRFLGANVINNWIVILTISVLLIALNGTIFYNELDFRLTASFALFLLIVVVPVMLHGAIAGERERRSWDMLLVAPVTKPQIIAGKFLGVAGGIAAIIATLSVSIVASDFPNGERVLSALVVILLIAGFAYGLAGFTLFVSARSSRSMTALGVTYGCLFLALLVTPMLTSIASPMGIDTWLYLHPFFAISQINAVPIVFDPIDSMVSETARNGYFAYGIAQTFVYIAVGIFFLYRSVSALYSEGWEGAKPTKEIT